MKLRIDYDRCSGHGRCYELAPNLVTDDDSGYGQVIAEDIDESQEAEALLAVNGCPERAITLEN
jgi:ferredoxin